MNKFLKSSIIFTTGLIIFIIMPILYIASQDNYDRYTSINRNIISLQTKSQFDSLDVLFVGGSNCYSSINTQLLDSIGIKSYNLGIATAGVDFLDLILNDYLNNIQTYPRKIIITISPWTFSSRSDNFEKYPIHRYLENPVSNFEVAIRYNRPSELIDMYRKSLVKGLKFGIFSKPKVEKINPLVNKGFVESLVVFTDSIEQKDKHHYEKLKEEQCDSKIYFDLVKIAKNLEVNGIDVIFLETPTNKLHFYMNDSYLNNYNILLDKLEEQFPVIRLDSSKFKKSNYRNIDHMNSSGAFITTKEIINFLEKRTR